MSFNSGWGLAMWRSSDNVVSRNSFDWCVRGYSHGIYDRGQDSAGILVFEQCHRNLFAYNSATHGGDGFFLYAGHETLKKTGTGGCNDNRVVNNDFSHAVANAIEATFSRGNWFEGNRCDDSNYGLWAGYSYETTILGNTFENNTVAGIAIEHGEHNLILANTFTENACGIKLWWDDDRELLRSEFAKRRSCLSRGNWIVENRFLGDKVGLVLEKTTFTALSGNAFDEVGRRFALRGACAPVKDLGGRHPLIMQPTTVEVPGERKAFLRSGPRGRRFILVDEWGPVDPTATRVFPRRVVDWEACAFSVLGADGFRVEGLPDGLRATRDGRTLRISGGLDGANPFSAVVVAGDKRFPVSGVVLNATWTVAFYDWKRDPRKTDPFTGKPSRTETKRRLAYRWGGKGDRFATRATTRMRLAAGKYEIRTVSDDGVRVRIDGRVVQEDWTHHAPREHRTVVELAGGDHEIVVEHFELDGHAELRFDLRPLEEMKAGLVALSRPRRAGPRLRRRVRGQVQGRSTPRRHPEGSSGAARAGRPAHRGRARRTDPGRLDGAPRRLRRGSHGDVRRGPHRRRPGRAAAAHRAARPRHARSREDARPRAVPLPPTPAPGRQGPRPNAPVDARGQRAVGGRTGAREDAGPRGARRGRSALRGPVAAPRRRSRHVGRVFRVRVARGRVPRGRGAARPARDRPPAPRAARGRRFQGRDQADPRRALSRSSPKRRPGMRAAN